MDVNLINISITICAFLSLCFLMIFFKIKRGTAQRQKHIVNKLHFETSLDLAVEIVLYLLLIFCIINKSIIAYIIIAVLFVTTLRGFLHE